LRRACWGNSQWGCRKLLAHIKHLPRESAFARARNGDAADWTQSVELQASTVDALQTLTRIYINANSQNPVTDELKPYPRPAALRPPTPPAPENTITLAGLAGVLKEKI